MSACCQRKPVQTWVDLSQDTAQSIDRSGAVTRNVIIEARQHLQRGENFIVPVYYTKGVWHRPRGIDGFAHG